MTLKGEPTFFFAGLWRAATADWPESYAIITIEAAPDLQPITDRQPAVIRGADVVSWLSDACHASELLRPLPTGSYEAPRLALRDMAGREARGEARLYASYSLAGRCLLRLKEPLTASARLRGVPFFHFQVRTESHVLLTEGAELKGLDEARVEAARRVGELLTEHAARIWADEDWRMDVTDKKGLILFVLVVSASKTPATSSVGPIES